MVKTYALIELLPNAGTQIFKEIGAIQGVVSIDKIDQVPYERFPRISLLIVLECTSAEEVQNILFSIQSFREVRQVYALLPTNVYERKQN